MTLVSKGKLSKAQRKDVRKIVRNEQKKDTELKYHQDNGGASVDAATGRFDVVTNIAQGGNVNDRIGNKMSPTSLDLTIRVDATTAGSDTYNAVRVICFRWHPDNGDLVPDKDDILLAVSGTIPQCYNAVLPTNRQFTVLYDRLLTVQSGNDDQVKIWRKRIKLAKSKPVEFKSDASTTGINHIYMFAISDSNAVIHPVYEFTSLIRYSD